MKNLKEELNRNKELMGLLEDSFTSPETDKILERCAVKVGTSAFFDKDTPTACKKFMLQQTSDKATGDSKLYWMTKCTDAAYDEVFQDDEEAGDLFLEELIEKALMYKNCVEKKGVNVDDLLDELL
tara:strand:- start:370 stop:747 length:378 start_codon:yes stop_codon:yes gene_type:complete